MRELEEMLDEKDALIKKLQCAQIRSHVLASGV